MANANTDLDLADLHAAIVADIRAQFPDLKLVAFYHEEDDRTPPSAAEMPACLLQLTEWEAAPDSDTGTEQFAASCRFDARFILPFTTPQAKLSIRKLAASFCAFLRSHPRWNNPNGTTPIALPTGPAEVIGAYPDDFSPALDQYEVWRVEWTQQVDMGNTVWTDDGTVPTQVLFSYSPDIGTPNQADYQPLEQTP